MGRPARDGYASIVKQRLELRSELLELTTQLSTASAPAQDSDLAVMLRRARHVVDSMTKVLNLHPVDPVSGRCRHCSRRQRCPGVEFARVYDELWISTGALGARRKSDADGLSKRLLF